MTHGWLTDRRCKQLAFAISFAVYARVGYWLQVRQRVHHRRRAVAGAGRAERARQPRATLGRDRVHLHSADRDGEDPRGSVGRPVAGPGGVRAFAGSLVSAIFMAGSVVQIMTIGTDRGLPRSYVADHHGVVRADPDDRVLRVERHERGAVHLLPDVVGVPTDPVDGRRRRPPPHHRRLHRDGPGVPGPLRRGGGDRGSRIPGRLSPLICVPVVRRACVARSWTSSWSVVPASLRSSGGRWRAG